VWFGSNVLNAYNISEALCQVNTQLNLNFSPIFKLPPLITKSLIEPSQSQWPSGLWHEISSAAQTLESWV
jgi:hypothetical protein